MSEQTTGTTGTETTQQPPEGEQGEQKVFDADYVKKLRDESARYRTEAKANAAAATRLAEIEAANKTEAERNRDALAASQKEAAEARRDALRFKIASKHGITDEDADLFLTGSDEESLTRQAERLTARATERKKNGNHVPREGDTNTNVDNPDRAFARKLFGTED